MGLAGKNALDFGQWPQIPSLRKICRRRQPFDDDLRRAEIVKRIRGWSISYLKYSRVPSGALFA